MKLAFGLTLLIITAVFVADFAFTHAYYSVERTHDIMMHYVEMVLSIGFVSLWTGYFAHRYHGEPDDVTT
jgi:hypothetical protein